MLSGSHALMLSGSQALRLSCSHALTPACSHALMVSCSNAVMLSCSHALMLSCSHALMLSCSHAVRVSCTQALMLPGSHALMLSCSHALMLMPSCSHALMLSSSHALRRFVPRKVFGGWPNGLTHNKNTIKKRTGLPNSKRINRSANYSGPAGSAKSTSLRTGTLTHVTGSRRLDGTTLPACRAMPPELLCSMGRAWELVESEILELCTFYAWYAYFH